MNKSDLNRELGNINANTYKLIDKINSTIHHHRKNPYLIDIFKIQTIVADLQGSSPISDPAYFTIEEIIDFEVKFISLVNISSSNVHGETNLDNWDVLTHFHT